MDEDSSSSSISTVDSRCSGVGLLDGTCVICSGVATDVEGSSFSDIVSQMSGRPAYRGATTFRGGVSTPSDSEEVSSVFVFGGLNSVLVSGMERSSVVGVRLCFLDRKAVP